MRLARSTVGVLEAIAAVAAIAALPAAIDLVADDLGPTLLSLRLPSPALLRGIAGFGGAMVLAYVVQAVWMVREAPVDDDQERWVGFVTGAGIAGAIGVVLALLLAEHRAAGHANALDVVGSAWAFGSLAVLAGVVLLQPLLAHRLAQRD